MSTQLALPVELRPEEIAREQSLGGAIGLCIKAAGHEVKELCVDLKLDKAQISRWTTDSEGILWPKLLKVMDYCGNDAPVQWMNHALGYDLTSLRKRESETQRENRLLREEVAALRRVLAGSK